VLCTEAARRLVMVEVHNDHVSYVQALVIPAAVEESNSVGYGLGVLFRYAAIS
jgi:hypothetical protein